MSKFKSLGTERSRYNIVFLYSVEDKMEYPLSLIIKLILILI